MPLNEDLNHTHSSASSFSYSFNIDARRYIFCHRVVADISLKKRKIEITLKIQQRCSNCAVFRIMGTISSQETLPFSVLLLLLLFFSIGSALKEKMLLSCEQILYFKSTHYLKGACCPGKETGIQKCGENI